MPRLKVRAGSRGDFGRVGDALPECRAAGNSARAGVLPISGLLDSFDVDPITLTATAERAAECGTNFADAEKTTLQRFAICFDRLQLVAQVIAGLDAGEGIGAVELCVEALLLAVQAERLMRKQARAEESTQRAAATEGRTACAGNGGRGGGGGITGRHGGCDRTLECGGHARHHLLHRRGNLLSELRRHVRNIRRCCAVQPRR